MSLIGLQLQHWETGWSPGYNTGAAFWKRQVGWMKRRRFTTCAQDKSCEEYGTP